MYLIGEAVNNTGVRRSTSQRRHKIHINFKKKLIYILRYIYEPIYPLNIENCYSHIVFGSNTLVKYRNISSAINCRGS